MNYLKIAHAIGDYWQRNRRVGHTTAMLRGSAVVQALIVVADRHQARDIGREFGFVGKFVSLGELEASAGAVLAGYHKPLVMDHYAMALLLAGMIGTVKDAETREKLAQIETLQVKEFLSASQALVRLQKEEYHRLMSENRKLTRQARDGILGMIILAIALIIAGIAWAVAAA